MCPDVLRLIMNMYISQKMQVTFSNSLSNQFTVGNGVKQGGMPPPIIFIIDIDNLITILKQRNVGCKIGNTFFYEYLFTQMI